MHALDIGRHGRELILAAAVLSIGAACGGRRMRRKGPATSGLVWKVGREAEAEAPTSPRSALWESDQNLV